MAQPAGAQYAVAMPIGVPLHWGLVLVLGIFTGVFTIIRAFIQASFARKIDAHSKALTFYILWIVGTFVMIVLWIAGLVTRPNRGRSTVYSIRLNPDEVAALQSIADAAGVPGSTLARSWIVQRIQEEQAGLSDAEAELRAAQRHLAHLQRHLRQQAS